MTGNPTERMVSKLVRVLVVHDAAYDLSAVYDALRKEFILRVATSMDEAIGIAKQIDLACIVCTSGADVRVRTVFDAITKASPALAERFVFLRAAESSEDDALFLLTTGKAWLPLPVDPAAVVAIVRAVTCR